MTLNCYKWVYPLFSAAHGFSMSFWVYTPHPSAVLSVRQAGLLKTCQLARAQEELMVTWRNTRSHWGWRWVKLMKIYHGKGSFFWDYPLVI